MSVKMMAAVFDADLPRAEKFVLLAMADHADHEGHNIFPSVSLIAWKTGYQQRQVQRAIKSLLEKNILVDEGQHKKYLTNVYWLNTENLPIRESYILATPGRPETPDNMSPLSEETPDIPAKRGDIPAKRGDTMSPKTSYNHNKPLFEAGMKKGDILDGILAYQGNTASFDFRVKEVIAKNCGLTPNWEVHTNQKFLRWAVGQEEKFFARFNSFIDWWTKNDWRGKKGQPPTLKNIRELWMQPQLVQKKGDDNLSVEQVLDERQRALGI